MAPMNPRIQAMLLAFALGVVVVSEVIVVFFTTDRQVRVSVGVVLLILAMWLSGKLGVVEHVSKFIEKSFKRRTFLELRENVDLLIAEVRRLNWVAQGAEKGFRNKDAALKEMDALEERLHQIIGQIRRSAGRPSVAQEALTTDD